MSEEDKNDETPETPEAEVEETAAPEPEEAPAPEAAPEAEEAPSPEAEEAPSPEAEEAPAAEEPPEAEEAPEPEAALAPAAAAPAEDAEPEVVLTRKQQRKLRRSTHEGEANPPRSEEERIAECAAQRAINAKARSRSRAQARAKHEPREGTPPAERVPGTPKIRQGTVTSAKADKTITIKIDVVRRHPRYEKVIRRTASVHAHDENNEANAGDTVRLVESRPLSRTKRWRLVEVLDRAR